MPRCAATYALGISLSAIATGCGEDAEGEAGFERPQIIPDSNVLCLSYDDSLRAASPTEHFVGFTNRGRENLLVEGGRVEEDQRASFTVDLLVNDEDVPCLEGQPCPLRTGQDGFMKFTYHPETPGWDAAFLRIRSNAENYPDLRIFVLALARPDNDPSYDPGPKPDLARGADNTETCP